MAMGVVAVTRRSIALLLVAPDAEHPEPVIDLLPSLAEPASSTRALIVAVRRIDVAPSSLPRVLWL
jgi:hypothetical protein